MPDEPLRNPITASVFCVGCRETKELTVEYEDYDTYMNDPYRPHVQDLFPYLSVDQRELLISNTCGECFDKLFPPDDDEAGVKGNN